MRTHHLLAGILIFIAGPLWSSYSQATDVSAPGTSSVSPHPAEDPYAKEPYVFEFIETRARFEVDGKGQRDFTVRVRIQSESAVHEFGLLVYSFASSFESLDVISVRVRKPDGSVLITPASDIQELDSAVSREAPMYTDQREKHIAVKSLAVGDVLEAHLHWTIHDPIAPGHFWYDDSYFRAGICLKESLELDVPANVPVKLRHPTSEPSIREEANRRIYTFTSSNLKHAEESKIPDWETNPRGLPLPEIELSSFPSWEQVGSWYDAMQRSKAAVSPEIRAKAEELTKGKPTDDEKIRALYDFVSTRFRYIGVDLGLSRYTPHAASDVLVNRYGDCKDKHTLFAALLQAAGITAYPALISSKFKIDSSFASPSAFDHVITAVPKGDGYLFLDTTPEVAPFGLLTQNIRNREALVIPATSPARLITTPAEPPMPDSERAQIDASIDAHGTLDAKMRIEDRGDGELALRIIYRATPQNRWQELTQRIVANMGFAGTVSDVTVTQPEDFSQPFAMSFSYHRTDYPDWKNHRVTIPSPPILIPTLTEEQKLSKDPLPLGSLQEVVYESTIKFPKDYIPVAPEQVDQKSDFAEFSAKYVVEKQSIHATLRLKTLLREVPGSERGKFDTLSRTIDETVRRYIFVGGYAVFAAGGPGFFKPPASDVKDSIPNLEKDLAEDPENKTTLTFLSQAYCAVGRAKDAVALVENALAKNPEHAEELHLSLGQAYLALPDADKAIPHFDKGLGDDPPPALLDQIAKMLADANAKLPEALAYSNRAVKLISSETMDIAPVDPSRSDFALMIRLAAAWDTIGWIKFRMGDPGDAEKFLQASWQLDQTASAGEHLVEVYEKLGKLHKGAVICNMAQALPNTSASPVDAKIRASLAEEMKRLKPSLKASSPSEEAAEGVHSSDGQVALVDIRCLDIHLTTKLHDEASHANFLIAFMNGSKAEQVRFLSGSEELRGVSAVLSSTKYPQTFPDDVPARILRRGSLSCSVYSQQCLLLLSTVADVGGAGQNIISFPTMVTSGSGSSAPVIFTSADRPLEPFGSPAKPLYDSARAAGNSGEYGTSTQLYERAVVVDPSYMDAWNSLGWTYNKLRNYEKAEAALRKAIALVPTARYAHNNLGEALEGQKKYVESIPEFQKEIELNPKDPWAHENLGVVYAILKQYENAVPILEGAAALASDNPAIQFNLGRSYARTGRPEKAVEALRRSVELQPTAFRWNAVAYEMALDKLDLDQAEKYVESAISVTVKHLNEVILDDASEQELQISAVLGAYWDTLGWIKFQQGSVSDAEKYVRCAWQLTNFSEIADHLGQIYEKADRKSDAIQMYSMALAVPIPMSESNARLEALLNGNGDKGRLVNEARAKLPTAHTLSVKNMHKAAGEVEFWVVVSPNAGPKTGEVSAAKITATRFISGEEALRSLSKDLETLQISATFPGQTEVRLVLRGKLTCAGSSSACSLVWASSDTTRSVN
jgi:tetratricopeptide (TPR) repeat protein